MPSKGVDYSMYTDMGTGVNFYGPKVTSGIRGSVESLIRYHMEIDSGNLDWNEYVGTYGWDVYPDLRWDGVKLLSRQQKINTITGNLNDGDFTQMMNTPACVLNLGSEGDVIVTYGFYDAGSGLVGLPNADQSWVTVVRSKRNWMAELAREGSPAADKPFSSLVLAGAHDAGMNTMATVNMLTGDGSLVLAFFAEIINYFPFVPGFAKLLAGNGRNIIMNLSMTQKDTFNSMLDNGIRYFDFRPAYLVPGVRTLVSSSDDTLYHTHLVIPGARFDRFLQDIVAFLTAHPGEIVVVRTCSDGIKLCELPEETVIRDFARKALQDSGIELGNRASFQKSIAKLRSDKQRLILVHENPKYDSYDGDVYATLNPAPILNAFSKMTTYGQLYPTDPTIDKYDFTVLQCQGTAESTREVLGYAITAANGATSPLMATKGRFDAATLPWIFSNAVKNLKAPQNIILLNDFVDGALGCASVFLTWDRIGDGQPFGPTAQAANGVTHLNTTAPSIAQVADTPLAEQLLQLASAQNDLDEARARRDLLERIIAEYKDKDVPEPDSEGHDMLGVFEAALAEAKAAVTLDEVEVAQAQKLFALMELFKGKGDA